MSKKLVGGSFEPPSGSRRLDPMDAQHRLEVSVILRRCKPSPDPSEQSVLPPGRRRYMTREQLRQHGSSPDHRQRVTDFAAEHGLEVVSNSSRQRTVVLAGTTTQLQAAFGVDGFYHYEQDGKTHYGFTGEIHLPEPLHEAVEAVLGLHNRPLAGPRVVATSGSPGDHASSGNVAGRSVSELRQRYAFPEGATGKDQTVAVIELAGGYRLADVDTFASAAGLEQIKLRDVSVGSASNQPAEAALIEELTSLLTGSQEITAEQAQSVGPALATFETTMDIELIAAFAPDAQLLAVFTENSERGLWQAVQELVHTIEPQPTVINLSWSWNETDEIRSDGSVNPLVTAINGALRDAANLGITFCTSSGDDGSAPDSDGKASVHFPASSPFALGCGGTQFASDDSTAVEEVWSRPYKGLPGASSGGVSRIFELPDWQDADAVPPSPLDPKKTGRGVPDVAAVAAADSCCPIVLGGVRIPAMGTSASAPLWAALLACLAEKLGLPHGHFNPRLYQLAREQPDVLHSVTIGSNDTSGNSDDHYPAAIGWDPCTGLGTPIGQKLLTGLED